MRCLRGHSPGPSRGPRCNISKVEKERREENRATFQLGLSSRRRRRESAAELNRRGFNGKKKRRYWHGPDGGRTLLGGNAAPPGEGKGNARAPATKKVFSGCGGEGKAHLAAVWGLPHMYQGKNETIAAKNRGEDSETRLGKISNNGGKQKRRGVRMYPGDWGFTGSKRAELMVQGVAVGRKILDKF